MTTWRLNAVRRSSTAALPARKPGRLDEIESTDSQATLQDVVAALKPPHTIATLRYTLTQIARNPVARFLALAAGQAFESRAPSPRTEPQAGPDTGLDGLAGDGAADGYLPGSVH
jgi:hypothetical protein